MEIKILKRWYDILYSLIMVGIVMSTGFFILSELESRIEFRGWQSYVIKSMHIMFNVLFYGTIILLFLHLIGVLK